MERRKDDKIMMLAEFDLKYVVRKSVKGGAIAEFLSDIPVEEGDEPEYPFPDEK